MDDQSQQLVELSGDDANALAKRALESEYVVRLEEYLDERGEAVPTEDGRAFERGDGVRAVTFAPETDGEARPPVAITVHFDGDSVAQATAEHHDSDDGTVDLVFPTEIAPRPEAAVNDILRPDGKSVEVTVDESDEITVYTVAL
ncbi:hypothetical protein [Natronorubrum sp. FCH18a]|uniref:hypothetical protein n=1 Tax=Natronorubrum sp. FCH18a TaxID=3447018 RepID=UPI003F50F35D